MHPTDDLMPRSSLMVAHAAAQTNGSGLGLKSAASVSGISDPKLASEKTGSVMSSRNARGITYADGPLDGFTILPDVDADRREIERLHEDDGA